MPDLAPTTMQTECPRRRRGTSAGARSDRRDGSARLRTPLTDAFLRAELIEQGEPVAPHLVAVVSERALDGLAVAEQRLLVGDRIAAAERYLT